MDEYRRGLNYAHGGTYGLFALATATLGVWACIRARRRGDPARVAFTWLQMLFPLAFLTYGLNFASYMVYTAKASKSLSSVPSYIDSVGRLNRLEYGLASAGSFFRTLADCALFITLAEVGIGFTYALAKKRTRIQKIARYLSVSSVIPLVVLAVVEVGWGGALNDEYLDIVDSANGGLEVDQQAFDRTLARLNDLNKIHATSLALSLVITIALVIQAAIARNNYRGIQPVSDTVNIYLAATGLSVVRAAWTFVEFCLVSFGHSQDLALPEANVGTDIALNILIFFVVLLFLFSVGHRLHNGLWTTLQPWMNGIPTSMVFEPYASSDDKERAYQ